MRLQTRFRAQSNISKLLAIVATAVLSTLIAGSLDRLPGTAGAMRGLSDVFYDGMYRLRSHEDRTSGDVVIITLDDGSFDVLAKEGVDWPFRRDWWGMTVNLLEQCGAKVVVFDVDFLKPSVYRKYEDDDQFFANALDAARIPVVMGVIVDTRSQGSSAASAVQFGVPIRRPPIFGAVNILSDNFGSDKLVRVYKPVVQDVPSLATRAASMAQVPRRDWAGQSFRLHYYGPHAGSDGRPLTYKYVPVWSVFAAAKKLYKGKPLAECGIDPALFRGKIVLIGYTAAELFDLKASPLSDVLPGVEVHATAIDNLLQDRHVRESSALTSNLITFAGALLAAISVTLPRRVTFKLVGAGIVLAALLASALAAFLGHEVYWLPLAAPLLGGLLATLGGFAWTYFAEGRQRQQIVRAFSQVMSPELVAQIERDPRHLDPGGERREMTVMFTDLVGFTTLTERLDNHTLVKLLNFYFEEMAPRILEGLGTLDKYIGDAIMSFWNAPIPQPDHAAMACRAALRMAERERTLQAEFLALGADRVLTRIGINTGPMIVGFTGSGKRLNYSVLGDSVNLGSRLEGANKLYGSQILISDTTAQVVKDRFVLRRLDVLQVKGKHQPMPVYELMAEGPGDDRQRRLAKLYEAALEAYQKQRWDDAEAHLAELAKDFPDDPPAAALSLRIANLRRNPPPADWDGIYVAHEK